MNSVYDAISFARGHCTYTHFLTGNDCGVTGSHQAGFLIAKSAWPLMFPVKPERGDGTLENLKRYAHIFWHGGSERETDSVFTYYRRGTRDEFRLTRFGRGFDRLNEECTGDLLVLCLDSTQGAVWTYHAWTLQTDEDISTFLDAFGMGPGDTNSLLATRPQAEASLLEVMTDWAGTLEDFPGTDLMAETARALAGRFFPEIEDPDRLITRWISLEYDLFRVVENFFYQDVVRYGFPDTEAFLACAQTLLQRRKARAGKSLEKHLSCLFTQAGLRFSEQAVTELNKKPDFVFPGITEYHRAAPHSGNVIVLGAKTTCKDRWRQIITEADRVDTHYLFTLQQGISRAQLAEMRDARVQLVVPRENIVTFPAECREALMTTSQFIELAATVAGS